MYICTLSNPEIVELIVNRDYKGLKELISAIEEEREAAGAQSSPFSLKSSRIPKRRPTDTPESLRREPGPSHVARTPSSQHHHLGETTPRHTNYGSSGQSPPLSGRVKYPSSFINTSTLEPLESFVLPPPARSYTDVNVIFSVLILCIVWY